MRIPIALDNLCQDIRYSLRTMRRNPAFTAVAILSLALGAGANTAIFSLINSLMLHMMPVREPGRLVELMQHYPGDPRGNGWWSLASFEHYRDNNHVFAGLSGTSLGPENSEYVMPDFFDVLGTTPSQGRLIGSQDPPGSEVAVVSYDYAKSHAISPSQTISLQDRRLTVVGVAPRGFRGLLVGAHTDIWMPRPVDASRLGLVLIARLKPGVTIDQARAEMAVLFPFTIAERQKNSLDPQIQKMRVEIEPAGAGLSKLRDLFARPLLALMGVVGLLLLIACTNVASLLLARGAARRKEMAVRVSLGAGRVRLVCQVLTESMLLSGAGALLGVLLAYFGAETLVRILASGRPIVGLRQTIDIPLTPDLNMLVFTLGIALAAGILFGLAPAWNAFRTAPAGSLADKGVGETASRRFFGKGLVIAQVALSVILLSAAGLFVGYLANLETLDLGFRRDHLLIVNLEPRGSGYNGQRLAQSYQRLLDRMRSTPGVTAASICGPTPVSGAGASRFANAEGFSERKEDRRYISVSWVAPDYFTAMGTPLLAGRDFSLKDRGRVIIVNQSMARHYFGASSPLGRHVTLENNSPSPEDGDPWEIIGVAGDTKYYEIREPVKRTVYLPLFQNGRALAHSFVLRTKANPASVAGEVERMVRAELEAMTPPRMTTMTEQIDASIVPERLVAALSGSFGALGLLLASIGIYGLLAYTVARRIREFGIRFALGANPGNVITMVLGEALLLIGTGVAAGTAASVGLKRFAAMVISDLPTAGASPVAFGAFAMIIVALSAALIPARRASKVDPMEALRYE